MRGQIFHQFNDIQEKTVLLADKYRKGFLLFPSVLSKIWLIHGKSGKKHVLLIGPRTKIGLLEIAADKALFFPVHAGTVRSLIDPGIGDVKQKIIDLKKDKSVSNKIKEHFDGTDGKKITSDKLLDFVRRLRIESWNKEVQTIEMLLRSLEKSTRTIPASEMVVSTGWSKRTFNRRFKKLVGLTAIECRRVFRIRRFLQNLSRDRDVKWSALAGECGFSDQAHMIREVKASLGKTPGRCIRAFGYSAETAGKSRRLNKTDVK